MDKGTLKMEPGKRHGGVLVPPWKGCTHPPVVLGHIVVSLCDTMVVLGNPKMVLGYLLVVLSWQGNPRGTAMEGKRPPINWRRGRPEMSGLGSVRPWDFEN